MGLEGILYVIAGFFIGIMPFILKEIIDRRRGK